MNHLYSFSTASKIIAGPKSIEQIVSVVEDSGVRNTLILTDPGVYAAGLTKKAESLLRSSNATVDVVKGVLCEPPVTLVDELHAQIGRKQYDMYIGIGGGSTLDMTKLLAARTQNHEPMHTYLGTDKITKKGLPTLLIPTTAGTGSEVTPNAIVTLEDQQLKVGIVSRHLLPDYVIADPHLTLTLPPHVTAATGMDAFIHSLESYISNKANPLGDTFALHSMRLIGRSILRAYHEPENTEARHQMLIGSLLGGMALTASGTAAVHALAYPLGGRYSIPHGVANSMLLVPVLEYNLDSCAERLSHVAEVMAIGGSRPSSDALLDSIKQMVLELKIPRYLDDFGVSRSDVSELAVAASKVERLLRNNPKPMCIPDIEAVYSSLFR